MPDSKTVIFVTGADGRLGRPLTAELLSRGYAVRALVKDKAHALNLPAGTVPYLGDVSDSAVLNDGCKGASAVVHLAAIVSESSTLAAHVMHTNVYGTRNVLEASKSNEVKRFVFASSVDVYGRVRPERLTEDASLKPTDVYGRSKALAEQEIISNHGDVDYTILRMAAIYGHGFEKSYFKLLKLIRDGKAYIIGRGTNKLALVHITDVVSAYVTAIEHGTGSSIFNLSDGEIHTQKDLFDLAAILLKVPPPSKHASPVLVRLMARARNLDSDELRFITSDRTIDITRLRKTLGFTPSVGINEGMGRMVELFLERTGFARENNVQNGK